MQSEGSKPSSPSTPTCVEALPAPPSKIGLAELPVDVLLDIIRAGLSVLDVIALRQVRRCFPPWADFKPDLN